MLEQPIMATSSYNTKESCLGHPASAHPTNGLFFQQQSIMNIEPKHSDNDPPDTRHGDSTVSGRSQPRDVTDEVRSEHPTQVLRLPGDSIELRDLSTSARGYAMSPTGIAIAANAEVAEVAEVPGPAFRTDQEQGPRTQAAISAPRSTHGIETLSSAADLSRTVDVPSTQCTQRTGHTDVQSEHSCRLTDPSTCSVSAPHPGTPPKPVVSVTSGTELLPVSLATDIAASFLGRGGAENTACSTPDDCHLHGPPDESTSCPATHIKHTRDARAHMRTCACEACDKPLCVAERPGSGGDDPADPNASTSSRASDGASASPATPVAKGIFSIHALLVGQ